MKRVEAAIFSWQSAAGRRYCHWCLALASGAVSHGDGALSLTVQDSPLMLFKFERQPQLVTQLSMTSAADRATRAGEDSY